MDVGIALIHYFWLCHVAAFWLALGRFGFVRAEFFVLGLGLGGALTRLGWGLLHFHLPELFSMPEILLRPGAGFTILFFPLGPLLLLALSEREPEVRFDDCVRLGRALPPAFALARSGCIFAGCCSGRVSEGGWSHGVPLYEMLGWLFLTLLLERIPDRWVPAVFFGGFGLLRLLVEPFRAVPPLGETIVEVEWLALAWLVSGLGGCLATIRRRGGGGRGESSARRFTSSFGAGKRLPRIVSRRSAGHSALRELRRPS